jgi:hypothetical protein
MDTTEEDDIPISKQVLNFMFETKEIKVAIGFWTFLNLLMLVLLIYVTFKVTK